MMIDNVGVDSAKISFVTGDHLFTYGPRNTTVGKNQFKATANTTYFNDALDTLGYGALDNQFGSIYCSAISINSPHIIPQNSIGVID